MDCVWLGLGWAGQPVRLIISSRVGDSVLRVVTSHAIPLVVVPFVVAILADVEWQWLSCQGFLGNCVQIWLFRFERES